MKLFFHLFILIKFIVCHEDPYLALDCDKYEDSVTNEIFSNRLI
jgi:hypothetical protein